MRFHTCAVEIVRRSGRSPFRHLGFGGWFVDNAPDPGPKRGISTGHAQPTTAPDAFTTRPPAASGEPVDRAARSRDVGGGLTARRRFGRVSHPLDRAVGTSLPGLVASLRAWGVADAHWLPGPDGVPV